MSRGMKKESNTDVQEKNTVRKIFITAIVSLVVWNLAYSFLPTGLSWLALPLSLPLALFLPGLLTILIMGIKRFSAITAIYAVAFSILELMLLGFIVNMLPQELASEKPLAGQNLYIAFNVFIITLLGLTASLVKTKELVLPKIELRWRDICILIPQLLLVMAAVFGAISLNDGGSNILTITGLFIALLIMLLTILWRNKISRFTIFTSLIVTTFSILIMTSLRSWYIPGHDMQHEFQVYNLAIQGGRWDIKSYGDAYNACLSITILPVMLSKLTQMSGEFIFKAVFQLLFAFTPVVIFLLLEKYVGRLRAYLGAIIFIALPSFSIDVPSITRQEIALLFFALVVLGWFSHDQPWLKKNWKLIFLSMSFGVILSHYSTTYLFVATLCISYLIGLGFRHFGKKKNDQTNNVPGILILIVSLSAFLWFSQVTAASTNLRDVLANSIKTLQTNLTQDNQDTSDGNSVKQLLEYVDKTKVSHDDNGNSILNNLNFQPNTLPPSATTVWVRDHLKIDLSSVVHTLYYIVLPAIYQILIFLGVILLISPNLRKRLDIPTQYVVFSLALLTALGLEIVMPEITQNYGITRAFLQAYIVLALPLLLGFDFLTKPLKRKLSSAILVGLVVVMFTIYSGLLPQILGGVHDQLSLNNSGQYFGGFYIHTTDIWAYNWIEKNIEKGSTIHIADNQGAYAYHPQLGYNINTYGILPFQVTLSHYVLLSYSQTVDHLYYMTGSLLPVRVDNGIYSDRNLLYSNGEAQLYK